MCYLVSTFTISGDVDCLFFLNDIYLYIYIYIYAGEFIWSVSVRHYQLYKVEAEMDLLIRNKAGLAGTI